MSIWQIIDSILFKPLQLLFEVLYMYANSIINNPGFSIIVLSLVMNFLVLPLYKRADAMQEEERDTEARLHAGVSHIKKTFKGDEKMMILQTYYRQNNYKPTYVLKGAISLFLEIPFFIAAYRFLSGLELLKGVSFGPIRDLGAPDALLTIGALTINVLPIIMTAVNLVSCIIFTKGAAPKTKIQLYAMAVFFLFFLYTSPSGLVFYWTLNNVFSLVKTIFYKLKNPKKVLAILSTIVGLALIVSTIFVFTGLTANQRGFILLLGVALLLPLLVYIIRANSHKEEKEIIKPDKKIFICSGIFLALFTGLFVPLSVIKANPQEFVNSALYENPLFFALSCFCIALGTFVVWFNIFYWLASPQGKHTMNVVSLILCGVFALDFMLFGKNLGNLSSSLIFDNGIVFESKEILINIAAVVGATVAIFILYKIFTKHMFKVVCVLTLAIAILIPIDIVAINNDLGDIKANIEQSADKIPSVSLSKNGKNVVVIMLDRALGEFIPIIFNEKGDRPDLIEKFDGFTAYTNVISYGTSTNIATPSLFGGYDYTPVNLNKRDTEKLVDKHNEALKVMPALFSENNYNVTFFDPVYANYQWVPDLSLFNDHPEWNVCISKGKFADTEMYNSWKDKNMRNFFCYSIMKCAPAILQEHIYNEGRYFRSTADVNAPVEDGIQVTDGMSKAYGIDSAFLSTYQVLTNLTSITKVDEDVPNSLFLMVNDTTHEPIVMQEPEFVPQDIVDNTDYDAAHTDRFSLAGKNLNVTTDNQTKHYQTNVAAYLRLAEWFDYLRSEGIYDNTKIILVSDHGRFLDLNDDLIIGGGNDIDTFYPILLVKDFNSKGFELNDEFMTIADVPTLATEGAIDNAVNPFTGNKIKQENAKDGPQYICASYDYDVSQNCGTQFLPCNWIKLLNNDMSDPKNWQVQLISDVFPQE